MGWWPCPECCSGQCEHCSGETPDEMHVVLSGITNDNCNDCDDLNSNGSPYILGFAGEASGVCTWRYTLPSAICTIERIDLTLEASGSDYLLAVSLWHSSGIVIQWTETISAPLDCVTLNNQNVTYASSVWQCIASSSTCMATAS